MSWAVGTSIAAVVLASAFVLKNVGDRFREAKKENPELKYISVFKIGDLVVFGAIIVIVFLTGYLGKMVWANFNTAGSSSGKSSKHEKLPSLDSEYDAPDTDVAEEIPGTATEEGFDD